MKNRLVSEKGHSKRVFASKVAKNANVGILKGSSNRYLSNRAKCLLCGEIIESKHRHHFVPCHCGNLIVDGGLDYLKRIFNKMDSWVDLSEIARSLTAEVSCEGGDCKSGNEKKCCKLRKNMVGNKRLARRRVQKEVRIK